MPGLTDRRVEITGPVDRKMVSSGRVELSLGLRRRAEANGCEQLGYRSSTLSTRVLLLSWLISRVCVLLSELSRDRTRAFTPAASLRLLDSPATFRKSQGREATRAYECCQKAKQPY